MLWSRGPKPRPGARPWPSASAGTDSIWSLGYGSRICPCLKIHPWTKATGCFWAIAWGSAGSRHLPALPGESCIRAGNGNLPTCPSPPLTCFPVPFGHISCSHITCSRHISRSLLCPCSPSSFWEPSLERCLEKGSAV